jgi:hypothetical protein
MSIFVNQPYDLYLEAQDPDESDIQLSDSVTRQIYYIKPDGTSGSWSATLAGTANSKLYHRVTGSENDQSGVWYFHNMAVWIDDPNHCPGDRVELTILNLGEKE